MTVFSHQVGALPWRESDAGLEVLLITARRSRRWLTPKGNPMAGRSDADAAAQEAWEEAGVRGEVAAQPIGAFTHRKSDEGGADALMRVDLYPLRVTAEAETWPEAKQRRRRWTPVDKAALLVGDELGDLITAFATQPTAEATTPAAHVPALQRLWRRLAG